MLYTSTEGLFEQDIIAVSGALFLPEGTPPKGGWPLLAWTHGTVGVADICAPSWNGRQSRDTTYLNYWLANGYAIVASDYQGLGTPGTHPYLATRPESYSNLDAIRAVQRADFPVSDAVVLFGQSQGGGAALATGGFAQSYAPELDIRGIVATGPPYFSAEAMIALDKVRPRDVVDPKLGYNFLAMAMLGMIDPTFRVEDYVSKDGLSVAKAVDNTCYAQIKQRIKREGLTYNRAFKRSPTQRLEIAVRENGIRHSRTSHAGVYWHRRQGQRRPGANATGAGQGRLYSRLAHTGSILCYGYTRQRCEWVDRRLFQVRQCGFCRRTTPREL